MVVIVLIDVVVIVVVFVPIPLTTNTPTTNYRVYFLISRQKPQVPQQSSLASWVLSLVSNFSSLLSRFTPLNTLPT